ncbi:MAG: hypothetical protein QOD26_2837 [Betaproteobacteria bacterium]|jgi:hypothetical protein|nr:hypothetical protein [Betaproteobacteria bacterium]
MHCELVVPGLLDSRTRTAGARPASLELLVARGRRSKTPPQSLERWLQQAFGLEGRFAAGALSVLGAGGAPGDAIWTRADPVHMQVMRDRVVLAPAAAFPLARGDADTLCQAVNAHFAGALELRAIDPSRWCARLESEIEVGDEPPLDMAGREATQRPGDVLLTEIQMLLHGHPVNEAREARGEPAVNSLWFWGAGRLPGKAENRWQSVTSDDPIALGMARNSDAAARPVPASASAWLSHTPEDGRHVVILDPASESLERDWFAPLAAALRAGRIGMLSLHVPDAGLSFETVRGDLRRFWRRPKALETYA